MLNKIIKRGQRKLAKSDVDLASASRCRNSVGMSPSNIILSHGYRGGSPQPNLSQQQQPHPTAVLPSRPPLGTIENLPMFRDVLALERQSLFQRKVKICCHLFDFCDTMKMVREKEIKRQTLVELVDFIQSGSGKITELIQNEMVQMIALNIFRCLPPASYDNTENLDPDEEEPFFEPSWPHLQLVYELLLRYVVSTDMNTKVAKRYIDHSFILKLLDLFDSEDPREREYLKTILHRIYAKFMVHRPFIRKAMNNIFYRFIYETERHNGIAELLEILGSIINGFALPMKEEHKLFLARVLIPLHKPKPVAIYHEKLSYCVTQFVEKDYKLADMVIMGLLRYWPATNSEKEVLFLAELEEVLEVTHGREFQHRIGPLFGQIAHSICSSHFQVSERALFLWNNEHIFGMISQNRNVILPIIFEALEKNIRSHWNQAVLGLTVNVRKMFLEMDVHLFNQCQMQYAENVSTSIEFKNQREVIWQRITAAAAAAGG